MNIGIIHPYFDIRGGAEATSISLIDALKKSNHHITLYTVSPPELSESKNFHVAKISKNIFPLFSAYQRAREIEKLFKISSDQDLLLIMSGGLTLQNTKVKRVLLYCNSTFVVDKKFSTKSTEGLKGQYQKILQKKIKKSFSCLAEPTVQLISNSEYTKNEIKKQFGKDSIVVYPPVKINPFSKFYETPKEKKVVTVSRFSPEKNLEFTVEVMKLTNIKYELIGEARRKKQIEMYNKLKEKSSKNITLYSNIKPNEIQNIVSTSKVYFHPSEETFGIVVVEAIAAGCIPIVPNNSAHKETVPFSELRYNDKDDALRKINNAIMGNYDSLKSKLFQHIKQFSEESFQNRMIDIIDGPELGI